MTTNEFLGHGDPLLSVAMKKTDIVKLVKEEKQEVPHATTGHGDPLFQEVMKAKKPKQPLHVECLLGHGDPLLSVVTAKWDNVKPVKEEKHEIPHTGMGHGDPLFHEVMRTKRPTQALHIECLLGQGDPLLGEMIKTLDISDTGTAGCMHQIPHTEFQTQGDPLFAKAIEYDSIHKGSHPKQLATGDGHGDPLLSVVMAKWDNAKPAKEEKHEVLHATTGHGDPLLQEVLSAHADLLST